MGQPLAKATCSVSAHLASTVLASVSPELHNKLTAKFSSSVANSMSAEVRSSVDAFSGNWIDSSKTGNTSVQVCGGGVLVLLTTVVLTGSLREVLAFVVVLVGSVVGAICYALQAARQLDEGQGRAALQSLVEKDTSEAATAVEVCSDKAEVTDAVLQHILGILSTEKRERLAQDANCHAVATTISDLMMMKIEFHRCSYWYTTRTQEGKEVKELANQIQKRWSEVCLQYATAFHTLQNFFGPGLQHMERRLEVAKQVGASSAAVSAQDLCAALNLDKAKEAVTVLAQDPKALVEQAQDFLSLVQSSNEVDTTGQALFAKLQERQQAVHMTEERWTVAVKDKASLQGEQKRLEMQATHLELDKAGLEQVVSDLEKEEAQCGRDLAAAEADEKAYTFRMWGPWVDMWKNDTALAKEKVQRKKELKAKLRERIEAIQTGRTDVAQTLKAEREHNSEHLAVVATELQAANEKVDEANKARLKAKAEVADVERELAELLQRSGHVSLEHLVAAQSSLNRMAARVENGSMAFAIFQQDLGDVLQSTVDLLEQVFNMPTLKMQFKALQVVKGQLSRKKAEPLVDMIKSSSKAFTLSPKPEGQEYLRISAAVRSPKALKLPEGQGRAAISDAPPSQRSQQPQQGSDVVDVD